MIDAGRAHRVLVVTSERLGDPVVSLHGAAAVFTTASAALLERSDETACGFRYFAFQSFDEHLPLRTSYCARTNGSNHLLIEQHPEFTEIADKHAAETVKHVAATASQHGGIQWLLWLGNCGHQRASVARELGLAGERVIVPRSASGDLFTSSFVYAWQMLQRSPDRQSGDQALVVQAGSGMRVVGALYRL
jgi:3-oxoacyl-[acyl-carrier-protein] synthase III